MTKERLAAIKAAAQKVQAKHRGITFEEVEMEDIIKTLDARKAAHKAAEKAAKKKLKKDLNGIHKHQVGKHYHQQPLQQIHGVRLLVL